MPLLKHHILALYECVVFRGRVSFILTDLVYVLVIELSLIFRCPEGAHLLYDHSTLWVHSLVGALVRHPHTQQHTFLSTNKALSALGQSCELPHKIEIRVRV